MGQRVEWLNQAGGRAMDRRIAHRRGADQVRPNEYPGVLDHEVTLASGTAFYNPMRVQPNGQGSEVMFTLYRLPKVSNKAYAADARHIRRDLEKLKSLLEK
jgi:hypothetical protein